MSIQISCLSWAYFHQTTLIWRKNCKSNQSCSHLISFVKIKGTTFTKPRILGVCRIGFWNSEPYHYELSCKFRKSWNSDFFRIFNIYIARYVFLICTLHIKYCKLELFNSLYNTFILWTSEILATCFLICRLVCINNKVIVVHILYWILLSHQPQNTHFSSLSKWRNQTLIEKHFMEFPNFHTEWILKMFWQSFKTVSKLRKSILQTLMIIRLQIAEKHLQ